MHEIKLRNFRTVVEEFASSADVLRNRVGSQTIIYSLVVCYFTKKNVNSVKPITVAKFRSGFFLIIFDFERVLLVSTSIFVSLH